MTLQPKKSLVQHGFRVHNVAQLAVFTKGL